MAYIYIFLQNTLLYFLEQMNHKYKFRLYNTSISYLKRQINMNKHVS